MDKQSFNQALNKAIAAVQEQGHPLFTYSRDNQTWVTYDGSTWEPLHTLG